MRITENELYKSNDYISPWYSWIAENYSYTTDFKHKTIYAQFTYGGMMGDQGLSDWYEIYPYKKLPYQFTVEYSIDTIVITSLNEIPRSIRFKETVRQGVVEVEENSVKLNRSTNIQGSLVLNSSLSSLKIDGDKISGSGTIDGKKELLITDFTNTFFKPETIEKNEEIDSGNSKKITFESGDIIPNCIWVFQFKNWVVDSYTTDQLIMGIKYRGDFSIILSKKSGSDNKWELKIDNHSNIKGNFMTRIVYEEYNYKLSYTVSDSHSLWYNNELITNGWTTSSDLARYSFNNKVLNIVWTHANDNGSLKTIDITKEKYDTHSNFYDKFINISSSKYLLTIDNNVNVTGGMTLGGSLTIPSNQSIEIGEINLEDLEENSIATNGYFYIYYNSLINEKPTLFYYNSNYSNQNVYIATNYKLEMPTPGKVFTINGTEVKKGIYRLPIQIKSIKTTT